MVTWAAGCARLCARAATVEWSANAERSVSAVGTEAAEWVGREGISGQG